MIQRNSMAVYVKVGIVFVCYKPPIKITTMKQVLLSYFYVFTTVEAELSSTTKATPPNPYSARWLVMLCLSFLDWSTDTPVKIISSPIGHSLSSEIHVLFLFLEGGVDLLATQVPKRAVDLLRNCTYPGKWELEMTNTTTCLKVLVV